MTGNFEWVKSVRPELTDEQVYQVLVHYDYIYFTNWLVYNQRYNPQLTMSEYVIDLPAYVFDNIFQLLLKTEQHEASIPV